MTEVTQKPIISNDTVEVKSLEEGGFFSVKLELDERIAELELECETQRKSLDETRRKLLGAEVGRRAALMGVAPERVQYILRLAALDDVFDSAGELDGEALGVAIDEVLGEIPELRGGRGGGAFNPRGVALTKAEEYRRQISDANAKGDLLAVVSLKRKARKMGMSV